MRIKVEGLADFNRLAKVLQDLYQRSPLGAQIHGLNLYLTLLDGQGKRIEFLNPQGEPIDILVYPEERLRVPVQPPKEATHQDSRVVLPFKRRATRGNPRPDSGPPVAA